ncbi:DUF4304 domain-containing protein [Actinotalea sp. C106]|uniref:DUF4304 domain-containing protein n=1 Tax=Actinotalea sp. C106 TaxID=2908644 RepID=UPI002028BD70|nr:DUF4304 domain-containing protein [Actinotalea sp. C106]
MTALDDARALMRDHLAPSLRAQGWRGSAGSWLRTHPTQWVTLGWQKDKYSDPASVLFTGNLAVISKDVWDAENVPRGRRAAKPAASTSWGLGWEQRLGALIPGTDGDRWWVVHPGCDLTVVASEVLEALSRYGLPALERALAEAEARPRLCWHNVGGRSWFEPCERPADVEVLAPGRTTFRCAEHADAARATA